MKRNSIWAPFGQHPVRHAESAEVAAERAVIRVHKMLGAELATLDYEAGDKTVEFTPVLVELNSVIPSQQLPRARFTAASGTSPR